MAKVEAKKKKVVKSEKAGKTEKKAKSAGKSKVSSSYLIELYVPQVTKIEGTVISRDEHGIVLQHKRRASSKLMRSRLTLREVLVMPAENGEAGTVVLRTNRRSIVRPLQYKGAVSFSAAGATIKTVSDGTLFIPENKGYRLEISAEEE
jgi:hypothetical protein